MAALELGVPSKGRALVFLAAVEMMAAALDLGLAEIVFEPEWGIATEALDLGYMQIAQGHQCGLKGMWSGRVGGRSVIELLPPDSYDSLYQYRQSLSNGSGSSVDFTTNIANAEVVRDERGTVLSLDGSEFVLTDRSSYDTSYQTYTLTFDGGCIDIATDGYDEYYDEYTSDLNTVCWSDLSDVVDENNSSDIDLSWLDEVASTDDFWINVREVDGRWFIDPIDMISSYGSLFSDAANA